MITKNVELKLTREEIESEEPIEIVFTVSELNGDPEESIVYTISYPKSNE